jgi:hypothetical protein
MEVHCFFCRIHELQSLVLCGACSQQHGRGSMPSVSMGCCATPSVGQCCLLLTISWQLHGYGLCSITHGAAAWMRKARGTAQLASLLCQHLNKANCCGAGPVEVEAAADPAAAGRAAPASGRSSAGAALSHFYAALRAHQSMAGRQMLPAWWDGVMSVQCRTAVYPGSLEVLKPLGGPNPAAR